MEEPEAADVVATWETSEVQTLMEFRDTEQSATVFTTTPDPSGMEPTTTQQALSTSTFSPSSLPALLCSVCALLALSPSEDLQHPVSAPPSQTCKPKTDDRSPCYGVFQWSPCSRAVVSNLFGARKQLHGRHFFHGPAVEGMISR